MYLKNGRVYEGYFKNDDFYGKGIITYPDGNIFTGEFKSSQTPCIGKLFNSMDRSTYIGELND